MEYIKIFGYTRCGTNYITKLTKENLINAEILVSEFCSKHNRLFIEKNEYNKIKERKESRILKELKEENKTIDLLITIKNPYAWYNSMLNWRGSSRRDSIELIKFHMDSYNKFYSHYFDLELNVDQWGDKMIIKYEDLLKNPDMMLNKIASKFGVEKLPKIYIPKKVNQSEEFTNEKKEFYLNNVNNYNLTDFEIEKINDYVDPTKFGYNKIF